MTRQDKQRRVGAGDSFGYNSVELDLLANCDRYEVDSNAL
jgi:hypothetical protein